MLERIPLEKILFLDIETVPQTYDYGALDEETKHLFELKNNQKIRKISGTVRRDKIELVRLSSVRFGSLRFGSIRFDSVRFGSKIY